MFHFPSFLLPHPQICFHMWGSLGTVQQSNSRGLSPARDKENCLTFVFHKASSEWTHCGVCTLLSHSNMPHACMGTIACKACNPQEFWELFGHQYYCCCFSVFNVRKKTRYFILTRLVDSFVMGVMFLKSLFEESCLGLVLIPACCSRLRGWNSESAACQVKWSWWL